MKTALSLSPFRSVARAGGFSLLEVMIALTLGLLLSIGIVTLFSGTSRMNKLQDGLARLQENGRFAVTQIARDLRMSGAQFCSNTTGSSASDAGIPILSARAPMVYAPDLKLPDSAINSIDVNGNPVADSATVPYVLSPRWFIQGYSCTDSACTPELPSGTGQIPGMGLADGQRVPASDVLTVRYQRGTGWSIPVNASCPVDLRDGDTITINQLEGDDPVSGMAPGLALISDCVSPAIVPVAAVSGDVMTVGVAPGSSSGILGSVSGALCRGNRMRDMRLFNFSSDFVTVSYYLAFRADDNPDARPNSSGSDKRLIPVLIRRENGREQELVRGVDQMAFRFGVLDSSGNTRFLSAKQVDEGTECTPPPPGAKMEPGCMWRTVRVIEPHLLVNTVDEVFGLDDASRTFHFDGAKYTLGDGGALPSGLSAGSQLRREFVTYVSSRNHNF